MNLFYFPTFSSIFFKKNKKGYTHWYILLKFHLILWTFIPVNTVISSDNFGCKWCTVICLIMLCCFKYTAGTCIKPSLKLKNKPEPNNKIMANEKFPSTGILLYHSKFVGKSQRKSDNGVTKLNTLLIILKIASIESQSPSFVFLYFIFIPKKQSSLPLVKALSLIFIAATGPVKVN